ncbi:MAG: tetratricopeptide repeat protein [Deltaproteobacteria bacterium]|nr:tetratricopeptide repeat protein [Deltaproteobacteria bacterium]
MKRVYFNKIYKTIFLSVVCLLTVPLQVRAQSSSRIERNGEGQLVNQDYFTAKQYPEVQRSLSLVEGFHLNERVMNDFRAARYSTVIGDLKYALDKFPNHPKALMLLSATSILAKSPALAAPFYEKALRLYPQYPLTNAQYGKYLVDIGRVKDGVARLQRALQLDPKSPQAQRWLAEVQAKSGGGHLGRQPAEQPQSMTEKESVK